MAQVPEAGTTSRCHSLLPTCVNIVYLPQDRKIVEMWQMPVFWEPRLEGRKAVVHQRGPVR